MANAVVMPRQGQSVESCILTAWNKAVGDTVNEGDILFSYETDKAAFEENAKVSGTLLARFFEEDDDVPCLSNVAVIGEPGEDITSFAGESEVKTPDQAPEAILPVTKSDETVTRAAPETALGGGEKAVSPRARALAQRMGVNAALASGTGPHGRIIERDVEALSRDGSPAASPNAPETAQIIPAAQMSAGGDYVEVKQSSTRKAIARGMLNSLQSTAQLTNHSSFDATQMLSLRARFKAAPESMGLSGITLNDIMLYACSRVLKNHPDLNAHFVDGMLRRYNSVNLGMAVDTPRGLLVPTIFNADKLSLKEISSTAKELAAMAQTGGINPDLLTGATFTISNLGGLGVEMFTPVINPPQTGILGVCCIVERVRQKDGAITAYPSMGLSLTYDHRVVDGAPAARFIVELKAALENAVCLLV